MGGRFKEYFLVKSSSFTLEGFKAKHWVRIWGMSSRWSEQVSDRRQFPLRFVQCLHKASVLYRPESMDACIVAIATFDGEDPAVVKSGWQEVIDMKHGLKKDSDDRGSTSERSDFSQ